MRAELIVQSMQSRRSFVTLVAASPLLAISRVRAQAPEMISRPGSGYRFLPGGPVFAGGAVAGTGYEIVHALLARWLPLKQGYALVEGHSSRWAGQCRRYAECNCACRGN